MPPLQTTIIDELTTVNTDSETTFEPLCCNGTESPVQNTGAFNRSRRDLNGTIELDEGYWNETTTDNDTEWWNDTTTMEMTTMPPIVTTPIPLPTCMAYNGSACETCTKELRTLSKFCYVMLIEEIICSLWKSKN